MPPPVARDHVMMIEFQVLVEREALIECVAEYAGKRETLGQECFSPIKATKTGMFHLTQESMSFWPNLWRLLGLHHKHDRNLC